MRWCFKYIFAIIFGIIGLGFATLYLWNWLVPELFNGPLITIWQAFGLIILSKILFGSFKGKHNCSMHKGMQKNWKEKYEGLSDEEKEKFKNKFGKWCKNDSCE